MQRWDKRGIFFWTLIGVVVAGWSDLASASRHVGEALPKDADIALVLDSSQWNEAIQLHAAQSEFWSGRSSMTDVVDNAGDGLRSWQHYLADGTTFDWGKGNPTFLIWADIRSKAPLEAAGIAWTTQLIRPKSNSGLGWSSYKIDGIAAHRLKGGDFCWAQFNQALVYGHCLPMKRQLRHLKSSRAQKSAVGAMMKRYHQRGLGLYWSLGKWERVDLSGVLGEWGVFLASVNSGYIETRADGLEMRLRTSNSKEQKGVVQALYGFFDLLLGELHQLKARGRLGQALDIFKADKLKKTLVKKDDRFAWASGKEMTSNWATPEIQTRPQFEVSATFLVEDWGLFQQSAMSLLSRSRIERGRHYKLLKPDQILKKLRQLQWEYRDIEGSFVECGPIPQTIPQTKAQWPEKNCFAPLGFDPGSRVGYQISASILRGKLQLVLRQDLDGDGVPTIWVLGEDADSPTRYPPL